MPEGQRGGGSIAVSNDYGSPSYWDERYSAAVHKEAVTPGKGGSFDWYNSYGALRFAIRKFLVPEEGLGSEDEAEEKEILIAGCGNSTFGCEMYDDGFRNITNIDVSEVVINQMADKYSSREDMEFTVMDVRNMEYIPDETFDAVIDKALFDALLCGDNNLDSVQCMLREVFRSLKPGGYYIMISHAPPANRMHYLTPSYLHWDVEVTEVPKPTINGLDTSKKQELPNHFMYACRK